MRKKYLTIVLVALLAATLACADIGELVVDPVEYDEVNEPVEPVEPIEEAEPTEEVEPVEPLVEEEPAIEGESALVLYVIDGDTIQVDINGVEYRVRYIGINTPERDEVCYQDATEANAYWVEGQIVTLVKDVSETDRYDRLLRHIYVGDVWVNEELIADGWAEAVYYEPDVTFADYFYDLEDTADAADLGCHPTGIFD